jgi:hypothetical protein
MGVVVTYDSNNSGGSWWLDSKDWEALEEAGWNVHWVAKGEYGYSRPSVSYENPLVPCPRTKGEEWLGGEAMSAAKEFDNPADAIPEWERLTGECASDPGCGCGCCGPPHSFSYEDDTGYHYATAESTGWACEF